jgi:hypothetical protein
LGKLQDCELVFSVRSHAKQKKISAKAELESLAVDAALEDKDIWSQHGYRFFFISRHYYWGDDEVHITDNEGLFLFKWLVLGDKDYFEARRYFLRNMRRKIGAAFLKEVTEL